MERVSFVQAIGAVEIQLRTKKELERKLEMLRTSLREQNSNYLDHLNAQKLLTTVSDDNTEAVLDFITGIVNKTLGEIFVNSERRIYLKKKLFAGSKPHIVVELLADGNVREFSLQSGNGLQQIVSLLFTICLIEIRKGRRLLIIDEKLFGLHKRAKKIMSEILTLFAEGGFQFIMVEYGINDIGKIYNVEKPGDIAKVYSLDNGIEYNDESVYLFTEGMQDMDLSETIEDEREKDLVGEVTIGGKG